jgi:hypothetical protein
MKIPKVGKVNPVKKNMDKFHKPRTHKDKTKYDRKSESEKMQDECEPIWYEDWENEGGYTHPTEHDESDDLEDAKVIADEYRKLNKIPT